MMKRLLLPMLLLLFWVRGPDVVDARYASRVELDAHGGGGLPPILPGSVHDIRTVNNLDLDTRHGEFAFSDTDAGSFFARLSLQVPRDAPFQDWMRTLREYRNPGHVAWSYRETGEVWVFFCDPIADACDYASWTSRDGLRPPLPSSKQGDAGYRPE